MKKSSRVPRRIWGMKVKYLEKYLGKKTLERTGKHLKDGRHNTAQDIHGSENEFLVSSLGIVMDYTLVHSIQSIQYSLT